ncbi:MAG TPA: biosynthetic peptidoglycan transglycosylase [Burkholderiaceae bacterium]|nr:biosynthetic peptidoglycan transglycosylase [Burkholderiaceae bacterium]
MKARRVTRRLLVAALLFLLAAALGAGGALAVLVSGNGVLSTAPPAWTTRIAFLGVQLDLNVAGLVRLATAPGVAHLLDGRSVNTRAGRINFRRAGESLTARCAPCRLQHAVLASEPLQLAEVELSLARRDATVSGWVASGAVRVDYTAEIAADRVRVRWTLPRTDVGDAVQIIASIVPEARWGRFNGAIEASGVLTLPQGTSGTQFHIDQLQVADLGTEALQFGAFTLSCQQPDGRPRRQPSGDGATTWIALDKLGPYLPAAVIAAEDQRFHEHGGYDEEELAALLAAVDASGPPRGASTLTQQLARTLFTGGERTAARKVRELLYAVEMERTLGKARIIELYLNTVDWGPGLCGARAAARTYFGKSPARLTPIEAAWLAGILRRPHAAYVDEWRAQTPQRERAAAIVLQMRDFPRRDRQHWAREALTLRAAPATPNGDGITRAATTSALP